MLPTSIYKQMNTVHQKINLFKDIKCQFLSSLESIETIKDNSQTFLNHIQYEFTHRSKQKKRFITKMGIKLRQQLLSGYQVLIKEVSQIFNRYESFYMRLYEQYRIINQTIDSIDPIYRQLLSLSKFTNEKMGKTQKIKLKLLKQEEEMINQRQFKEILLNKQYQYVSRQQRKKIKMIASARQNTNTANLMKMQRQQNERLIQLGTNIQKRQIEELNNIMDNCFGQLFKTSLSSCPSYSISNSSSIFPKSPISNQKLQPSKQHQNLLIYSNQHSSKHISLNIQSQKNSFVDLTCYQEIQNTLYKNNLQKIVQKQEQEDIESDQSRKYFINLDLCQEDDSNEE